LKLKFQTVVEKTAKNFRGLLYFAAPGSLQTPTVLHCLYVGRKLHVSTCIRGERKNQ